MMAGDENTAVAWRGALQLGDRWAVWRGDVGDGAIHRHFAAQAIIADQPVGVVDAHGRRVEAACVLIDPLTAHRIEPGSGATLIYVEPGKRLDAEVEALLDHVRSASSVAMITSPQGNRFWARWLASPAAASSAVDVRLSAAIAHVERMLANGPVPLQDAAARSALSPERFRHLFTEHMGLPYKRYVLWRRLRLATTELMAGSDVTTAAHAGIEGDEGLGCCFKVGGFTSGIAALETRPDQTTSMPAPLMRRVGAYGGKIPVRPVGMVLLHRGETTEYAPERRAMGVKDRREVGDDRAAWDTPAARWTPKRHGLAAIGDFDVAERQAHTPQKIEKAADATPSDDLAGIEVHQERIIPEGARQGADSCRLVGRGS